jgi:DNA repair photolyase
MKPYTCRDRTRMFNVVTETWNPISGCLHNCVYCWARRLALTKLKNTERYRDGFIPRLNENEFKREFNGGFVFTVDMGDIFSPMVKDEWVVRVLKHIARFPDTTFLILTKNPKRYTDFIDIMPKNAVLGATIETDDDALYLKYGISNAPPPSIRIEAMMNLNWDRKFISIEPILDFTENFAHVISRIKPFMVYVGYDNYSNRLPEPRMKKTLNLIHELLNMGINVQEKTIRKAWFEERQ